MYGWLDSERKQLPFKGFLISNIHKHTRIIYIAQYLSSKQCFFQRIEKGPLVQGPLRLYFSPYLAVGGPKVL